jgi:hypothetical protein
LDVAALYGRTEAAIASSRGFTVLTQKQRALCLLIKGQDLSQGQVGQLL